MSRREKYNHMEGKDQIAYFFVFSPVIGTQRGLHKSVVSCCCTHLSLSNNASNSLPAASTHSSAVSANSLSTSEEFTSACNVPGTEAPAMSKVRSLSSNRKQTGQLAWGQCRMMALGQQVQGLGAQRQDPSPTAVGGPSQWRRYCLQPSQVLTGRQYGVYPKLWES